MSVEDSGTPNNEQDFGNSPIDLELVKSVGEIIQKELSQKDIGKRKGKRSASK
jgi:hypothetical protein